MERSNVENSYYDRWGHFISKTESFLNAAEERVRFRLGGSSEAHAISAREVFLDAINSLAPEVVEDLRASAFEPYRCCYSDDAVSSWNIAPTWNQVRGRRELLSLRSAVEDWAKRWGLERRRWARTKDPDWIFDAALRLLAKWNEGIETNELTIPHDIYQTDIEASSKDQLVYVFASFALLVFDHVLEVRPWLMKSPPEDGEPRTERFVRDRSPEAINKCVRKAASLVGLLRSQQRHSRPGR